MSVPGRTATLVEIGAWVAGALAKAGIECVLVGGSAVSVHTNNRYRSLDVDLSTIHPLKTIAPVLKVLGFEKTARVWRHRNFEATVDFVSGPPAVGNLTLSRFAAVRTRFGSVQVTTPTHSVMDRLAAFYHWHDPQSLAQAVLIAVSKRVNLHEIERWSQGEGHADGFLEFRRALAAGRKKRA